MKRTVKKQFWFNREEAKDLQKKAKKACLTEAGLIRLLVQGYEPREKPDDRFYHAMSQVAEMGNQVERLGMHLRTTDTENSVLLLKEAEGWHKFQSDIESEFLRPVKNKRKWQ